MQVPLYGFVEGDALGLLVMAHQEDTMAELAARLTRAAAMRVEPFEPQKVYLAGRLLDPDATVGEAGLKAFDRIEVRRKRMRSLGVPRVNGNHNEGVNMESNMVGPVLEAGEGGRVVLSAIRALNAAVNVLDRGAYWRVLVPQRCEVTRAAIEGIAGRRFELPQDLERVMPAFSGWFQIDGEHAVWTFREAG